jgi:hypothetical protein
LWGFSATDVFAADDEGNIFHFDGSGWKQVAVGPQIANEHWINSHSGDGTIVRYRGIWGTSPDNLFIAYLKIVEEGKTACGAMVHYDGQQWSEMAMPQKLFH